MIGIYKVTNQENGMVYVGQSIDIENRWRQHKQKSLNGDNNYFHNALTKYGIDSFTFEVLEECSISQLDERERYWIQVLNSIYPYGYNMTDGGQLNHTNYIYLSKEQIRTIYDLLLNNLSLSINEIANLFHVSFQTISDINNGKTHREDTYQYPLRKNKAYQVYNKKCCIVCGGVLGSSRATYCRECFIKQNHIKRPQKDELAIMIAQNGFEAVGRKYNVTGNAIKRWCDSYGLPRLKKEIQEYVKHIS